MQKTHHFLGRFSFLQVGANFWQTDLFGHEKQHSVIAFVDLHFIFQEKNVGKKLNLPEQIL